MATTKNYDYPTDTPVVDENAMVTVPWGLWVNRTHNAAVSVQQSGVTADRPTSVLWIGRQYFDTTIGKPVFVKQVKPTIVWVDGAGTVS